MVQLLSIVACIASLVALAIMLMAKNKKNAISIVFSGIGLITGFVALSISVPRDVEGMDIDYLGIIVAILAAIATLLLAMQLYHAFNLKEDAKKVEEAKGVIEKYARQVSELEEKIKKLEEKTNNIDEEIKKRPVWETLTPEEYERRNAEGTLDENTFYATIEEKK